MAAPKALGWFIAICLAGLWIFIWIVKKIYKLIAGEKVPRYKDGNYEVVLTAVGDDPKALKKQLKEFKGYSGSLANKVMKELPSVVISGLDKETADDFKIILDETGATTEIRIVKPKAK